MLNMNSPVVQNLIQSPTGFNPYNNNGYIPQQPQIQQQNYYGYNPYIINQQNRDILDEWEYSYDPMPEVIVNENRGIKTGVVQQSGTMMMQSNPYIYNGFNNNIAFNGYMNPILMKNQMEAEKLKQREFAIQQGKIWRILLQAENNSNIDIDETVKRIESMYYTEPIQDTIPIKDKIIMEKNNYFAELEARMDYYKENNIPVIDSLYGMRMKFANYYNHMNELIGDVNNCDIVDYFTRVYPELRHEELSWLCERERRNLKNRYNTNEFNSLIDKVSADRSDSYYYKLMETFSDDGVKLTNGDGLTITPDEMEIKLPDRLLKNNQDKYYEQRKKFFDSIFNKGR